VREHDVDEFVDVEWRPTTSEGPQLHFEVPCENALTKFVALFRELAEGPVFVRLAECDFVRLKNIKDVQLEGIGSKKEPSRNLLSDKGGEVFRWVHDSGGWIQCAELAEGLKAGTHQYFDCDKPGDIEVRASFRESRR
jgi:hypothetical protein